MAEGVFVVVALSLWLGMALQAGARPPEEPAAAAPGPRRDRSGGEGGDGGDGGDEE
jgi:hypothetical protein